MLTRSFWRTWIGGGWIKGGDHVRVMYSGTCCVQDFKNFDSLVHRLCLGSLIVVSIIPYM
jgi:hypothetical protein